VSNGEFFGQNSCFGCYSHEVCVANPSGHHVQVIVLADPRAGAMPQIDSDIETFRLIEFPQRVDTTLSERHHLGDLRRIGIFVPGGMDVWRDHEVPGRIRKKIQDYEIQRPAMDDEALSIRRRIVTNAEDA